MLAYLFAGCLCLCIGTVFSIPRIWNYFFSPKDTYLKAGEYGETDIKQTWSLWKEPLNAWSSLAYSFYGFVMLYVAVNDYMGTTISISGYNEIQNYSSFSFLFSFSCIYLGIASFLFHASHHEIWRKADAGMTSGVTVLPFVIAIFCRVHIPLISDLTMVILSFVLQISLTHGYLPYGSSDILVPTFIGTSWFLELSPFYDGIVTSTQITAWLEVFFFVISGMLLRAVDIKRTSKNSFNAIIGIFILQALIFGYFLSINNLSVPIILVTGALVYIFPAKGHVAWHFFSSFALFHWWELLQSRAIQLSLVETDYSRLDFQLLSIVFFVVIKNAGRRLLMTLLPGSGAIRVRLIALFESTLFLLWGVSVMSDSDSTFSQSNSNWLNLIDQESVWTGPVFLSSMFQLYYYVRMAAYAEDAVYTITVPYSSGEDHPKDRLTRAHHIVAGILAISSVFLRQAKFAALGNKAYYCTCS